MRIPLANTWPATLPLPEVEYEGDPKNASIKGEDYMVVLRRSRRETSYMTLSVRWTMTPSQFSAFQAFLEDINGSSLFTINLRFPKSTDLTEWAGKFFEEIQSTYEDGYWRISTSLLLFQPIETY